MDEVFVTAVNALGNGQYAALSQVREDANVKAYFMKTLFKPIWPDETLAMFFQSRPEEWDFDEKTRRIRVRSDLDKQISKAYHEKRRIAQLPTALYTAVLKAGNPMETAAVLQSARDIELAALPIETFEALVKALESPPPVPTLPQEQLIYPQMLQGHVNAQIKTITAIPGALEKKGAGLSQLMEYFNYIAKLGGAEADPRVATQKIVVLKELCETAAVLIKEKGIDKCGVKGIYSLCQVAPFHVMALAISSLGEKGDGEDVAACASQLAKVPAAVLEGLSRDTLLRLAVASTKSKAIAQEILGKVATAAGATLAAWSMDDMSKLLMAVAKAKAGADSAEVTALYGRAAESVAGKLGEISDTQLIKVVLALGKVASMKDFLEAAAAEAVKRMPNIPFPQLFFLTQGFLPLGGSHPSLTQMLDFWAASPEDAKPQLTADQWAKFAQLVAPVAAGHSAFWNSLGKRLEAGQASFTDAGKASLEAAFPDGAGPTFDCKEALLKATRKKKESDSVKDSRKRSRSKGDDRRRGDDRNRNQRDDKERETKRRSRERERSRSRGDRRRR